MTKKNAQKNASCDLSIIIPFLNEAGNILPLIQEIEESFHETSFEVIAIDDASTDSTCTELKMAMEKHPFLRVIRHSKRLGQSLAIRNGVFVARSDVIGLMDGDRQNPPSQLLKIYQNLKLIRPDKGMITGVRVNRCENKWRRLISFLANQIRRRLLNDSITDTGCSLKVIDKEIFLRIPSFRNMHRYYGALTLMVGGKVSEISVEDRPRIIGETKNTSFGRAFESIFDLLGVIWLKSRFSHAEILEVEKNNG